MTIRSSSESFHLHTYITAALWIAWCNNVRINTNKCGYHKYFREIKRKVENGYSQVHDKMQFCPLIVGTFPIETIYITLHKYNKKISHMSLVVNSIHSRYIHIQLSVLRIGQSICSYQNESHIQ